MPIIFKKNIFFISSNLISINWFVIPGYLYRSENLNNCSTISVLNIKFFLPKYMDFTLPLIV